MNYRAALLALVAPLAASTLGVVTPTPTTPAEAAVTPPQPNIVLVTVDDMRADDIYVMSQTQELLGQLELTDFISNHPLCCPARAELLTGQFGQNNGVHHNNGGASWAGYKALLDIWLYVHVPLSFALLGALIAHIISVFFYW